MAAEFNPYHVWLSIPPDEQPANHYRLLSLRLFETNGDVIDSAADRQMAHLRTFQAGKHGELTQRLLNEVAAARVCLLDSKKRAIYDQQLRAKLAVAGAGAASAVAAAAPPPPISTPVAQALPLPGPQWDNLLGDPTTTPAPAGKAAAKASVVNQRRSSNRNLSKGIAAAAVLVAAIGIGLFLLNGSPAEGTLVFDWPLADRADTSVTVDNVAVPAPVSGPWEYHCPPGQHHIVAQHLAYKVDANVNVAAGEQKTVPSDWRPRAMLVLNWPLALRAGADLKIDGRKQSVSQHDPLEIAVEPGLHVIQIIRPNSDPIVVSKTVADDGRELVAVRLPLVQAKLVFDWPVDQRKDAELTVDGQSVATRSDSPFELTLKPGRHVVQITRTGFEPFKQEVESAAGAIQSIKPIWKPTSKAAPTVVETSPPVDTATQPPVAPEPAKKLPAPTAAEQERIAKQLNELYETSRPGPKDSAKAQELYDLAVKDGSSPAERYMLLMTGAELAAAAGDLNLALHGVDTLDAGYQIDVLDTKQKLLDRLAIAANPDQLATAIPIAEQLIDQAVAADQYDAAMVFVNAVSRAAARAPVATRREFEERLSRRRRDIVALGTICSAAKKAQETLDKTPADPEANLVVGRWRCFYKGDWAGGLPMLAMGSDAVLQALARKELSGATSSSEQASLGDQWWESADKQQEVAKNQFRMRATDWYAKAAPGLTGLTKDKIQSRLDAAFAARGLDYSVKTYSWSVGKRNVQLIRNADGFCYLSSVSGHFAGYGENVGVQIEKNGFWFLEAKSGQGALSATATCIEPRARATFKNRIKQYRWSNGAPPVKMLHKNSGICFLSAIEGHFKGRGEEVWVRLKDDGFWYLEGRSGQRDLGARAIGIEWTTPGAYSIEAKEYSWSAGDSAVKLLAKRQGFAFLSSVSGTFAGYGEEVQVYLGDDGEWYLGGRSGKGPLSARATAVRVSKVAAEGATTLMGAN